MSTPPPPPGAPPPPPDTPPPPPGTPPPGTPPPPPDAPPPPGAAPPPASDGSQLGGSPGVGCIVIGTLGLILLVVVGVIAVVLLAVGGGDDADAALVELERIVAETPLDRDGDGVGIGDLAACPVGRTTAVVDDLIDRIGDDRLTTVDRAAPGTFDDQYVIEYPDSGTRVVVCERTGDDPSIAAIGIGLAPRPDDLRAYLEELTGTTDIEIEGEPDIGETAGTVLRWICVESDDPFARFCEMLWDDGDLLLSFYVAGASSGRLDVDALLDVLADVVDDWIEALAD